jgi:hypothetical protein
MECPVYYKLRITLDDEVYDEANARKNDHYGPLTLKSLIEELDRMDIIKDKMTSSYEKQSKSGEYVRPHIHVHFKSHKKKEAIGKAIKRYWNSRYDEKLSGNKKWALVIEPYVVEDKLFCYPLKFQDPDKPPPTRGFTSEEIVAMTKAAKMTQAVAQEVAQKKGARKEESDTLYDRLEAVLDKGEGTIGEIIEFYMKENKPINDTTIVGYYNLYRLKRQRITTAEYADKLKSRYQL